MAWTAPMTFVSGQVLTAAQLNTYVRDNFLETAPAKASAPSRLIVTSGANQIVERQVGTALVTTTETTLSTTYADLTTTGPSVGVATGTRAVVWGIARMVNASGTGQCLISHDVSGATTENASDQRSAMAAGATSQRFAYVHEHLNLTPGNNTFTMKYRIAGGQGTFLDRTIVVMAL